MIYIIADTKLDDEVLLVEALNEKVLEERLKLKDTEKVLGAFADDEVRILLDSKFTVIST